MKDWLKKWWTGRTVFELILLATSLALALSLIGVILAWNRSLVPWATEWGNYAEWAGAAATLLGFLIAAYALRKNAKDEVDRREQHQRMEAARVVVTTEFVSQQDETRLQIYRAIVHNAASSPVRDFCYRVEYHDPNSPWRIMSGENAFQNDIGTVAPGTMREGLITISGMSDPYLIVTDFNAAMCWWFRDVHGDMWLHENGRLKKSRNPGPSLSSCPDIRE